jgi:hypothetical protein
MRSPSCFVILFLLYISVKGDNELARVFEAEINSLAESHPSGSELYLKNIKTDGDIILDTFDESEIEDRFNKVHPLPQEVKDKFSGIIFADTTVFQSFIFEISNNNGQLTEFVGAARNSNGKIEIAYVSVSSKGEMVQQYYSYKYEECTYFLFVFKTNCRDKYRYTPRGFNSEELKFIESSLRAAAYTHLKNLSKNLIPAMTDKSFVLSNNSKLFSSNEKFYVRVQDDGNLVVYYDTRSQEDKNIGRDGHPIWATGTQHRGQKPYLLAVENDGQINLWDAELHLLWSSPKPTQGLAPFRLIMEEDGQLNLYDKEKTIVWTANEKYQSTFLL